MTQVHLCTYRQNTHKIKISRSKNATPQDKQLLKDNHQSTTNISWVVSGNRKVHQGIQFIIFKYDTQLG